MSRARTIRVFALIIAAVMLTRLTHADDWPQWRGPRRDGVWRETGTVTSLPAGPLKPLWRVGIAGGYSGPTVAAGRVYVTDRLTRPEQVERVHCFDAATGAKVWSHSYPCEYKRVGYATGPRASVTIDSGRAYSLGTMGHLFCFDAAKGDLVWKKDCLTEYEIRMPSWAISAAPIVVGD